MKAVIVFGFYNSVLVRLQKSQPTLLSDHAIMWIPISGPHQNASIENLKGVLFDRLALGITNILVLAVVRRGQEDTYGRSIDDLIQAAHAEYENATVTAKRFNFAEEDIDPDLCQFLELSTGPKESFPASLAELESWRCADTLTASRLVILPRALNEARTSLFEDVELVYRSLKLLANEYYDLRVNGGLERKRRWHAGLMALGLIVQPSISKTGAGQEGNQYYVNYPPGLLGKKKFLDQHLKKGKNREERYCFRLYFFWDDKKKLVVVGWLPSHLDTDQT